MKKQNNCDKCGGFETVPEGDCHKCTGQFSSIVPGKFQDVAACASNRYSAKYFKFSNITSEEWSMWYSAIAGIKRGDWCAEHNGNYIIPVGNKLFFTSRNFEEPELVDLLEFDSEEEAIIFREVFYE